MSVLFLHHPNETDLALFAGGELGPLARWRIERHIQTCAECEDAVADFFHLQGDISELAELPPLDWAALSLNVRQAVAQARTKPVPGPGGVWHRPLVWQAGLASAALFCTFVVVRQFSPGPQPMSSLPSARQQAQLAEQQANPPSAATATDSLAYASRGRALGEELDGQRQDGDLVLEPAAPKAVGAVGGSSFAQPSERDSATSEIAKKPEADEQQSLEGAGLARSVDIVLPGDIGARSTPGLPAAEKAEESQTTALAVARRNTPPPAAPPPQQSAANERQSPAESSRGRGGQQPTSVAGVSSGLRAELKAAPETEALADRAAGQALGAAMNSERGGTEFRQSIAPASGPGFSVPPGGLRLDTTVAADGGLSYRSVDSRTGTITIYDVYAP